MFEDLNRSHKSVVAFFMIRVVVMLFEFHLTLQIQYTRLSLTTSVNKLWTRCVCIGCAKMFNTACKKLGGNISLVINLSYNCFEVPLSHCKIFYKVDKKRLSRYCCRNNRVTIVGFVKRKVRKGIVYFLLSRYFLFNWLCIIYGKNVPKTVWNRHVWQHSGWTITLK